MMFTLEEQTATSGGGRHRESQGNVLLDGRVGVHFPTVRADGEGMPLAANKHL